MEDTRSATGDTVYSEAQKAPSLGLALGGGGILGLAHIGVLEVLAQAGLAPSVLTGTSIGAMVAASCASGMSVSDMKAVAAGFSWRKVRQHKIIPTLAVYSSEPMRRFLSEFLHCCDFDSLKIPVAMVATDLRTSQMVVLGGKYLDSVNFDDDDVVVVHAGLIEAIRASCTVPVLFEPVEIDGRVLVDGVLTNNVPAGLSRRMGADVVVAVDLKQRRTMYETPSNIFEYIMQSQMIYRYWAVKNRHIWADVVIRPELREFGWDDTTRIPDIMAAGREAAAEMLPKILQALRDCPGRDAALPGPQRRQESVPTREGAI